MRVYLDTSALGGYYDEEFLTPTRRLFDAFRAGRLMPLVSGTLIEEAEEAPENVRALLTELLDMGAERLEAPETVFELQEAYLEAGVVGRRYSDDALHVAQATTANADVIASWNFKHLVRPERIRGYNEVNQAQSYGPIVIMTPQDILGSLETGDNEEQGI